MKKSLRFTLIILFFGISSALLAQPTLLMSSSAASCYGTCDGSATAVGSGGGGAPYTYDWSGPAGFTPVIGDMTGNISGLCAGKYYVTVTDGISGTANDSVMVIEPAEILADSITSTPATDGLSNGTFQLLASGGNGGPYTLTWLPTPVSGDGTDNITGAAGSYSVAISDGSCSTTKTFVLRDSCTLKIDSLISTSEATLNSGTARVVASGGAGPYSYLWDNGDIIDKATGLARGSHSVTVTDVNMCSVSCAVNVMGGGTLGMSKKFTNPPRIGKRAYVGDTITYTIKVWNDDTEIAKDIEITDVLPIEIKYDTSMATTIAQYDTLTNKWSIPTLAGSASDTAKLVFRAVLNTAGLNITNTASANWNTVGSGSICGAAAGIICNGSGGGGGGSLIASDSFDGATLPLWNLSAFAVNVCNGSCSMPVSVMDNGQGFMPYTYSWSDATFGASHSVCPAMILGATPYSVTVSDAGGESAAFTYTLIVDPLPNAAATPTAETICSGTSTSIALTADIPSTYTWTATSPVNISGAAAGSGSSISQVLTNVSNIPGTVTYTITPTSTPENCNGMPITVLVTVDPSPTITATPPASTITSGTSANINLTSDIPGTTFNWTYTPEPGVTGANNGSGTSITDALYNSNLVATTLSYTVNSTGPAPTSCPGSPIYPQVTINPPYAVTGTVINNVTCNGYTDGSAKAEPNGGVPPYSYAWSPSGITVTNVMGFNTVNGLAPGIHTVVVTDAVSVTSTASVTITEPPLMTFGPSSSTPVSCNGGTNGTGAVTIASGGQFPLAYYWPAPAVKTFSDNNGSTGGQMSAGTYVVTVSDAKGCSQNAPIITVTEPTAVAIDSITSTIPFCINGTNATATVYPKPGSGTPKISPNGYTFLWNTVPGKTTKTATGLRGGSTYQVSVFDSLGCLAKQSIVIGQPNPINISFSNIPVNCNGPASGSSKAKASIGKSPYSFKWYNSVGNNIGACAATTDSCIKGNLASEIYTVSVTDANGCTATSNTAITVENKPVFALQNYKMANCGSPNGYASINVTADYPFNSNITWVPDPVALGGSIDNDTAIYAPGGTYKAIFKSPLTGCKDTFAVFIPTYASAKPVIKEPSLNTICYGTNQTYNTSSSLFNYKWLLNGNEIIGAIDSTHTDTIPGNYQVVTYNVCGADTSLPTTLVVDSLPLKGVKIIPSGPTTFCFGSSVNLSIPVYSSHSWFKNGTITTNTTNSFLATGGGKYHAFVTNSLGCSGYSDTVNVQTLSLPTGVTLSPSGNTTFCQGQSVSISFFGLSPIYTYLWSTGHVDTNAISIGVSDTVFVVVKNSNGCTKKSNELIVKVNPLPNPKITPYRDTTLCVGKTLKIKAKGGGSYKWSTSQTVDSIFVNQTGAFWVTVTNSFGCKKVSDTINVFFDPGPVIPVISSRPLAICDGDSVILSVSGYTNYKWFNDPSHTDSSIVIKNDTTVFVTANQGGCILKSSTHKVTVHPYPAVPTVSRSGNVFSLTSTTSDSKQWYKNNVFIPGANQPSYAATRGGTYKIRVTKYPGGCYRESKGDTISFTAIQTLVKEDVLKIYPNPFQDRAKIQYELITNSTVKLEIYNILGEKVLLFADEKQLKGLHSYEISDVKSGIYFVRLIVDGKILTHKLTKN